MLKPALFTLLCLALGGCSDHGNSVSDFESRSVTVNGKTYDYRVFVPKGRDPKNVKIPVMLYLHGSGSRGDDNIKQADGFSSAIAPVKEKINFIIVLPQCREETFWASSEMASYALAALDDSVAELNGDSDRLYLAGFSLGGYGVWQIAAASPGKFAALIPVAGGVIGERPIKPEDRAAIIPEVGTMLDSSEPYKAVAAAIGQTPVWVFHGSEDDAVPVDFSRKMVTALTDAGNKSVKYTEYRGDGHMIFGKSFSEPGLFEWVAMQHLDN